MWKLDLFERANDRGKYVKKFILRNACVGDQGTMCLRENKVRAVFSLSFFFLRGYDVTKKALKGWNMVTIQKQAKRMPDIAVETTIFHIIAPKCY